MEYSTVDEYFCVKNIETGYSKINLQEWLKNAFLIHLVSPLTLLKDNISKIATPAKIQPCRKDLEKHSCNVSDYFPSNPVSKSHWKVFPIIAKVIKKDTIEKQFAQGLLHESSERIRKTIANYTTAETDETWQGMGKHAKMIKAGKGSGLKH